MGAIMKTGTDHPRVLAVDDSLINLRLLEAILGREGFQVVSTSRGSEVLDLALEHLPDLILLDVMMPEVDGLEVLGRLKAHRQTQNLPVLMVTARTRGEDVRRALEAGAFDYIKKPLDDVETVARVRSALRYKAQQDQLTEMATHDGLTGLYNHNLLVELLDRELMSARRKQQPVSFCMADIDHFKGFNDQYGHQAGDAVLREVSRVLSQGVRRSDPVGRYGGEEFGLVLGGCEASTARILCERLRQSVADRTLLWEGQTLRVTVSLGLACGHPEEGLGAEELVRRADRALYEAKEKGRNRLVC
jgi:two-component system cell cycle response regulator